MPTLGSIGKLHGSTGEHSQGVWSLGFHPTTHESRAGSGPHARRQNGAEQQLLLRCLKPSWPGEKWFARNSMWLLFFLLTFLSWNRKGGLQKRRAAVPFQNNREVLQLGALTLISLPGTKTARIILIPVCETKAETANLLWMPRSTLLHCSGCNLDLHLSKLKMWDGKHPSTSACGEKDKSQRVTNAFRKCVTHSTFWVGLSMHFLAHCSAFDEFPHTFWRIRKGMGDPEHL